ncbi:hypothetical protein HCU40_11415 [Pseudanabaena biceps]|nr:hypothetical protein [Pseudanabaena biceps]
MRLSALGLIGGALLAGTVSVASASAQQASISGSVTFTTPAGFTSTVSAESVLPAGFAFVPTTGSVLTPADPVAGTSATLSDAQVLVAPAYNLLGFSIAATSLSVGSSVAPTASNTSSFTAAAATILTNSAKAVIVGPAGAEFNDPVTGALAYSSANIEFISAIIKAGAGVSGLE